jgi:hypothetical protein
MRIPTPIQALSAAAAITLLVGCSGSSAFAPKPASPHSGARHLMGQPLAGYYSCPATGSIEYVSDFKNNIINVYAGKFAGQAPCGQIGSGLPNNPQELFDQTVTHDLYVANMGGNNVLVFHRGQMTPYNTYTDPSAQDPEDVTVAPDGTVIASNQTSADFLEAGSISTWIGGPNGGTFVGNFPMMKDLEGLSVTVKKNGTIYYSDEDRRSDHGALWSLMCPAGACGIQTRVFVDFLSPTGLAFDDTGDLLAVDETKFTADTFELPNPRPSKFPLAGDPIGLAISNSDHHLFSTELINNDAAEYSYPSGVLIGKVPGNPGGDPAGIAVDP